MKARTIGGLMALALLVVGIAYNTVRRGDQGVDMHADMLSLIEKLPDYGTHGSLYNGWFDMNHETTLEDNYLIKSSSGRRMRTSRSAFDGDGYLTDLFNAMAIQAHTDGYKEQAQNLRDLREGLVWDYEDE